MNVPRLRLQNQHLTARVFENPADVVRALGAVQAQDYPAAKWAIGQRLVAATDASIEQAIADRTIIRTWPLRGTLHIVAATDIHWMLALLAPRVIATAALRYRQLELDDATFKKCATVLIRTLRGGKHLTRDEIAVTLNRAGISTEGQRLSHILQRAAVERLICFGIRRGKRFTFTLLDEWAPRAKPFTREEALAELAMRYFTTRGPATLQDFTWWSGLAAADAREALEAVRPSLLAETTGGVTYWLPNNAAAPRGGSSVFLLPPFDEYLISYKDRAAVLDAAHADKVNPGSNGIFSPIVVVDGRVRGTWKRTLVKDGISTIAAPFAAEFSAPTARGINKAADRYATFMGSRRLS